ncbi:hypothetical protein INS49_001611 [Diaporthe citri]|uniref:uncharacterized protein n=1 Tax=Diaporthe citri TaxID=83186 RepID=UPI001C7FB63B|nr:uncharacterized protein INS49_001611 [Diaporthe citri]KAG6367422.1 hypothetical protein INS49_001611 [Diaporthe citri]
MRDLRLQGDRQKREREKFLSPFPGVTVAVALQLPADRAAPYELAHEDSKELKEGPPRSRGARQEATLASNSNKRRWIARCMAMWRGYVRRPRCVGSLASRLLPAAALDLVGHDQQERSPFRLRLSFTGRSREEIV